jgi:hypothetical protein
MQGQRQELCWVSFLFVLFCLLRERVSPGCPGCSLLLVSSKPLASASQLAEIVSIRHPIQPGMLLLMGGLTRAWVCICVCVGRAWKNLGPLNRLPHLELFSYKWINKPSWPKALFFWLVGFCFVLWRLLIILTRILHFWTLLITYFTDFLFMDFITSSEPLCENIGFFLQL